MPTIFPRVSEVDRADFIDRRWDYNPGHHATFLAKTQWGKTRLMWDLLKATATPQLPATILVAKPRDEGVRELMDSTGWKSVTRWPPLRAPWQRPAGTVLWPKHSGDIDIDDVALYQILRACLVERYANGRRRRGKNIVVVDEAQGIDDLGLRRYIDAILMRGAGMGVGGWNGSQRPFNISQNIYGQAEHMFLGYDPDKRSRKRFGEFGSIDPEVIEEITNHLDPYHFLYIRRTGPYCCIVGP